MRSALAFALFYIACAEAPAPGDAAALDLSTNDPAVSDFALDLSGGGAELAAATPPDLSGGGADLAFANPFGADTNGNFGGVSALSFTTMSNGSPVPTSQVAANFWTATGGVPQNCTVSQLGACYVGVCAGG